MLVHSSFRLTSVPTLFPPYQLGTSCVPFQGLSCVQSACLLQTHPLKCRLISSKSCLVQSLLRAHKIVKKGSITLFCCGLHSMFASKKEWWPQKLRIMCDEDCIELHILLPVKCLGFGMAKLAEVQDSPLSWPAVCSLGDVHCCWKYSVTWACSLYFPSHWCRIGGNFTYSMHPASTNTHTSTLSGFCSDPNELISCQSTPGVTDGFFMAFFLCVCVCSQNKQCCFSRGWMCEW